MCTLRNVCCGLLLAAVCVSTAAAQSPISQPASSTQGNESETRPALPTYFGDTGLWFVPIADTLPTHRLTGSLFRENYDQKQGLTDVKDIGLTAAFGISDRVEIFGSWKVDQSFP